MVESAEFREIRLSLEHPEDMFVLPQSDLFSEHRNFLTGVDYCISELRSRPDHRLIRLIVELPGDAIDENLGPRLQRTLRRYCEHRLAYNRRERRAVRLDGLSALLVGLPVAAVGVAVALSGPRFFGTRGNETVIVDTAGWVLTWIGLWFPLDTLLFSPLGYGRESRVLRRLGEAEVVVEARRVGGSSGRVPPSGGD